MARPIPSPPGSLDIRAAEIASYTHQDKLGRVVDGEGSSAGGGFATAHDWSSELVNLRAGRAFVMHRSGLERYMTPPGGGALFELGADDVIRPIAGWPD